MVCFSCWCFLIFVEIVFLLFNSFSLWCGCVLPFCLVLSSFLVSLHKDVLYFVKLSFNTFHQLFSVRLMASPCISYLQVQRCMTTFFIFLGDLWLCLDKTHIWFVYIVPMFVWTDFHFIIIIILRDAVMSSYVQTYHFMSFLYYSVLLWF